MLTLVLTLSKIEAGAEIDPAGFGRDLEATPGVHRSAAARNTRCCYNLLSSCQWHLGLTCAAPNEQRVVMEAEARAVLLLADRNFVARWSIRWGYSRTERRCERPGRRLSELRSSTWTICSPSLRTSCARWALTTVFLKSCAVAEEQARESSPESVRRHASQGIGVLTRCSWKCTRRRALTTTMRCARLR